MAKPTPQILNFYLIDNLTQWKKLGEGAAVWQFWGKVVMHLRNYMQPVAQKASGTISSIEVWWVPEYWNPAPQGIDIVVYLVPNPNYYSVIKKNGGDVSSVLSNDKILGVTDVNLKICEVYFDRCFQGSTKEVAGAAYHEAAHVKANQDNKMHAGKNGFLKESPDYNGDPTRENTTFFSTHIAKTVNQKWVPFDKPKVTP